VLAALQRIGHGVERAGNTTDFGPFPDVHARGIIAEPPPVRRFDQLTERAMDEPPGTQPREEQHQRGAHDDQEGAALRTVLDFGEGLCLVEAKADKKPSGFGPEGGEADDPLHAIEIKHVRRSLVAKYRIFVSGQLPANEPVVIGVASEVCAIAVRDGERGSSRSALPSDVVSEPIQAETRYDDAAHATIVAVKW
jgi:hypothetical protein